MRLRGRVRVTLCVKEREMDEYILSSSLRERKVPDTSYPQLKVTPFALSVFSVCVWMCLCVRASWGLLIGWFVCTATDRELLSVWCWLVEMVWLRDRHVILLACCCFSSILFFSFLFSLSLSSKASVSYNHRVSLCHHSVPQKLIVFPCVMFECM